MNTPITLHDVKRLAEGQVADLEECDRILKAMDHSPELMLVYDSFLSMDDPHRANRRSIHDRVWLAFEYGNLTTLERQCIILSSFPLSESEVCAICPGTPPAKVSNLFRKEADLLKANISELKHQLTLSQIADILGLVEMQVCVTRSRGRAKLKTILPRLIGDGLLPAKNSRSLRNESKPYETREMAKLGGKSHNAKHVLRTLRDAGVLLNSGKTIGETCQSLGVSEETFHHWRNKYGLMKPVEAKRLEELEQENKCLKQMVGDLSVVVSILCEIFRGN